MHVERQGSGPLTDYTSNERILFRSPLRRNERHVYAAKPPPKPVEAEPKPAEQTVEIFPGFTTRLRGAQETWESIEDGFYQPVSCMTCTLELCCILDADFVICPCCEGVTPVSESPGEGGAGLGCTMEDVRNHIASRCPYEEVATIPPPASPSKMKGQVSLYDIFPRHIAEALRDGREVQAEEKEEVTIFFSDIVGFTNISAELEPRKVSFFRVYQCILR